MQVPAPQVLEPLKRIASADGIDLLLRVEAIHALGTHARTDDEGVSILRDLLTHRDDTLREAAATALCRLPANIGAPLLSGTLGHLDPLARRMAVSALGFLGPDVASFLPALTVALRDVDPDVQDRAGRAIVSVCPPDLAWDFPRLRAGLTDRDELVILRSLARLERWLNFEAIRSALPLGAQEHIDPESTRALGRFDRKGLVGKVGDRDTATVEQFMREAEATLPTISTLAFQHQPSVIRVAAIRVIGGIGPLGITAVPHLIEALRDANAVVRREAADALGRIGAEGTGAEAALPALFEALSDIDPKVRRAAAKAADKTQP